MTLTTEQLINNAMQHLDQSQDDVDGGFSGRLTQQSIAYSLIAIAQELHKVNERAEIEIERQDRLQERKERTKEVW